MNSMKVSSRGVNFIGAAYTLHHIKFASGINEAIQKILSKSCTYANTRFDYQINY